MVSLSKKRRRVGIGLAALTAGAWSPSALAQQPVPACADLPQPIIYGTGGSAQRPVLGKIAAKLRGTVTVVYAAPGACTAIFRLSDGGPVEGTASYWEADGSLKSCKLPDLGVPVSYGFMGNSELGCDGITALPANIGKFPGPVETANFIVPAVGSPETSISAEAAYFVYGFGGAQGKVEPWDADNSIFGRDKNSFLTITLASAFNVNVNKLNKAIDAKTNEATVSLVAEAANPAKSIGVVAGEIAASYRSSVKTLAYQHFDQTCGYWPDSGPNKLDKRGVRDGLYFLWSPVSLFAAIDPATKAIKDPNTAKLVKYFTLQEPLPGASSVTSSLELLISSSLTPQCAMHVWRDGDSAPFYSYAPSEPCDCFFEATATGDAPRECTACRDDSGCGGVKPKCRSGYCEAY